MLGLLTWNGLLEFRIPERDFFCKITEISRNSKHWSWYSLVARLPKFKKQNIWSLESDWRGSIKLSQFKFKFSSSKTKPGADKAYCRVFFFFLNIYFPFSKPLLITVFIVKAERATLVKTIKVYWHEKATLTNFAFKWFCLHLLSIN